MCQFYSLTIDWQAGQPSSQHRGFLMSIRIMSLVWDNFPIGGSDKLVMLAMADWCNDQGESLHPSISSIAKKTCLSECQSRRTVHSLITRGFLKVVGNFTGGDPGKSRQYQFVLSMLTPSVDATPSKKLPLAPMHVTPSVDATPTPSVGESLTTNILPRTTIKKKKPIFDPPDWINRKDWDLWIKVRKPMNFEQMERQVEKLRKWKDAGLDYAGALSNSADNGNQGLFLPSTPKRSFNPTQDAQLEVANQIMRGTRNGNDRSLIDITPSYPSESDGESFPKTITFIR